LGKTARRHDKNRIEMKLHNTLVALFGASLVSAASYAVSLGEIRVNSYLSQPLDAEIDLVGLAPGEHLDLRLRIANDDYLERMGIKGDPLLRDLSFDVVRSGEQWLVRARSNRPVREPFLEFPLYMTWTGGHLVRKYTLLFDPPSRVDPARRAGPGRTPNPPASRPAAAEAAVDTYGPVRSGENLWTIANRLKPRGTTTREMMIALLRANPEAFIGGDIDRLRAGATLRIPLHAFIDRPVADAAAAAPAAPANDRPTNNVAASPRKLERVTDLSSRPASEAPPPAGPADADTASAAQARPQDRLRIVTPLPAPAPDAGEAERALQEQLLVKLEEIESNQLTASAMASRLSRLEAQLEQMQQLIKLKEARIAALQPAVPTVEDIPTDEVTGASVADALPLSPAVTEDRQSAASAPRVTLAVAATAAAPRALTVTDRVLPPSAEPASAATPWYEQYLWIAWVALALLALAVLAPMLSRRRELVPLARLPHATPESPSAEALAAEITLDSPALKKAADDFRERVRERVPPQNGSTMPAVGAAPGTDPDAEAWEDADEIVDWAGEKGFEPEPTEGAVANDEPVELEIDLQDVLGDVTNQPPADDTKVEQVPADHDHREETFLMSLDLARAYFEIGDREEAKDMLDRALTGARDPDQRRQIEELLQQIG
jgi:pilus assembly protein FimV